MVELLESWELVRNREAEKSGASFDTDVFFGRRRRRDHRFRLGDEGAEAEPELREFNFSRGR